MTRNRRSHFRYPKAGLEQKGILRWEQEEIEVCLLDESTVAWGVSASQPLDLQLRQVCRFQVGQQVNEVRVLRNEPHAGGSRLVLQRVREVLDSEQVEGRASTWHLLFGGPGKSAGSGAIVAAGFVVVLGLAVVIALALRPPRFWFADVQAMGHTLTSEPAVGESAFQKQKRAQQAANSLGDALAPSYSSVGRKMKVSVDLVMKLDLSREQLKRIDRVIAEGQVSVRRLRDEQLSAEDLAARRKQIAAETYRKVSRSLNRTQRQQWQKMFPDPSKRNAS